MYRNTFGSLCTRKISFMYTSFNITHAIADLNIIYRLSGIPKSKVLFIFDVVQCIKNVCAVEFLG